MEEISVSEVMRHKKRVSIIRLKAVKEGSFLFPVRRLETPELAAQLAKKLFEECDREMIVVVCVDAKCQPLSIEVVSIGTIDACMATPREIFKHAILCNAYGIFVFHNHVSGDSTPSKEDENVTRRILESGNLLGIKLLDHIVLGNQEYMSFRERGLFSNEDKLSYCK